MIGSSSADRRTSRRWRLLIGLQVSLLVFTLVAPLGTIAADPDPTEPPPSEEPSSPPSPEPSAEPTPEPPAAPDPTPAQTPEPTVPATPDPTPAPTAAPTTSPFIVTFAAGVSAADQVTAVADAGATTTDTIGALRMHAVSASSAAASALAADARVTRVEPDRSRATEANPSDPAYGSQWALPKIGWDQVSGTSISGSATVAILDTGVDASQPDLAGQLVAGASFVGGSATTDSNGHGTAMAGIVAASTDNGVGIAGVGFDGVSIMPVSVLGADGTGRDSDVIEGLVWAADHDTDVALMAFSASGYSSALQAAVDYAWSKGLVLVAATGNDGSSSASFPAGDRGVIGVSNTDSSDALNASSNYGPSTFLAAPGTGIVTLAVGDGTTTVTGTSASAAHVAAAAALLRASDESLANGVIVSRLARTADAAGTAAETGNGRLNLARAVSDSSTVSIQPAGTAPNGNGGPFVGPYVIAKFGLGTISSESDTEGNAGTKTLTFDVGLTGNGDPVTLYWRTQGGTATGGAACTGGIDYIAVSQLVGQAKVGDFTIPVTICGDSTLEANETFDLQIADNSGFTSTGGNRLETGVGTIQNDDAANAAPSVVAAANQSASEGTSTSFSLGSFTDAGPSPWAIDVDWGDSTPHTTFSMAAAGTITAQSHTYADGPATRTVIVQVTDTGGAGMFSSASFTVAVSNVAPTVIILGAPASSPEGTPISLTSSVSDPSATDVTAGFTYAWSVTKNASAYASGSGAAFSFTPNDNGTYVVSLTATDKDGGVGTAPTKTITVTNVAPTAVIANDGPVDEGSPATISLSNPLDPSSADTTAGFHYAFDCDGGSLAGATYAGSGTSPTTTCTFPDGPADEIVSGAIIDKDGGLTQYTTTVHVDNVAPITTYVSGPATVDESGTVSHVYVFSIFDPGADTVIGTGTTCGDNFATQDGGTISTNTTITFACIFPDGPHDYGVQANATDSDGATGPFTTFTVHANNVDPTADLANDGPIDEGGSATVSFTNQLDPSPADTTAGFHYAFSCTNGSLAGATYAGSGTSSTVDCDFDDPGTHTVRARIIDKDNGFSEYTTDVEVNDIAPTVTLDKAVEPASRPEPGGVFSYTLTITNTSVATDPVTITALTDDNALSQDCVDLIGTSLAPGVSTSCMYTATPTNAGSYPNTASVTVEDDEGSPGGDSDTATAVVTDVAPVITVTKTAGDADDGEALHVDEPGGSVTFHVTIHNGSVLSDPVTILTLTDDVYGDLLDPSNLDVLANTCATADLTVAPGADLTCSFNSEVSGNAGETVTDTVSATAEDNDAGGSDADGSDSVDVTFDDVLPTATLTKTVIGTDTLPEPGGSFVFRIEFTNTSVSSDPIFVQEIFDTEPITPECVALISGVPIEPGDSVHCDITLTYDNAGEFSNLAFGAIVDDENNWLDLEDTAIVTVTDVAPAITVEKTASPTDVDEPGASVEFTVTIRNDSVSSDPVRLTEFSDSIAGGTPTGLACSRVDASPINLATDEIAPGETITCKFSRTVSGDGPGSEVDTVTVTAQDNDEGGVDATESDDATVTIHNVAPTGTLGNAGPGPEGSPGIGVTFTGGSDPSSADTAAGFHYSFACTGGAAALATSYGAASASASTTCSFGDNGPQTVYGRIFDKDNGNRTYTTVVSVTNANPTTNTPVFNFNPITGVASASISYSDPGWLDTHTVTFFWGDGSSSPATLTGTDLLPPTSTGTASESHTYAVGCVANAPYVVVTDDDGGSATHTYAGGIDHYSATFQAPIQDGVRNIVKQGNVIPVKLLLTNCTGQPVLGRTLSIGYVQGDVYDDTDAGDLVVPDSVSNADTTGFMRQVDGKYMYNLATKTMKVNLPYTVVIREPSTLSFVASFVIYPKKS